MLPSSIRLLPQTLALTISSHCDVDTFANVLILRVSRVRLWLIIKIDHLGSFTAIVIVGIAWVNWHPEVLKFRFVHKILVFESGIPYSRVTFLVNSFQLSFIV